MPTGVSVAIVAIASTGIAGVLAAHVGSESPASATAAVETVVEPVNPKVDSARAEGPLPQAAVVIPPQQGDAEGLGDDAPGNADDDSVPELPPASGGAGNIALPEAVTRPFAIGPTYGGIVSSDFGPRWGQFHYGIDIAAPLGAAVLAVTDGVVLEAGPASGFGLWVRLSQEDGTVGVYGHVDRYLVEAGQHVRAGDMIATVGSRGHSTGPHLHYEVRKQDGTPISPRHWLAQRGVWLN
ncbi:M23 family metallopeptidase [Hoyosella rhizosphaerae]|nr:M23 family metallopeptidase [Hoyosella rhizosphaerae]